MLLNNKQYKTHPRTPAIGQADIVTDFGSKRLRYTWPFLGCLRSFHLILANIEPIREAIRTPLLFSAYASALPSLKFCGISYAVVCSTLLRCRVQQVAYDVLASGFCLQQ